MDIYQLIQRRQSDRKYDPARSIPREVLDRIVEAGRLAPSACNAQPWRFVVVTDDEKRQEVAAALTSAATGSMNKFAAQAPALIVVVEERPNIASRIGGLIMGSHFAHIDIGIATSNIVLAATHEGIGSCIIGWCNEKPIRRALGIPSGKKIPLVITLGYSLEDEKQKSRKSRDEITSYNHY